MQNILSNYGVNDAPQTQPDSAPNPAEREALHVIFTEQLARTDAMIVGLGETRKRLASILPTLNPASAGIAAVKEPAPGSTPEIRYCEQLAS